MKKFVFSLTIIFFSQIPLSAFDWARENILVNKTENINDKTQLELKDASNRFFSVKYHGVFDSLRVKKILILKDNFYSWKNMSIRSIKFFVLEKGLKIVIIPEKFMVKGKNYGSYMPAGMVFYFLKNLRFNFRMIKDSVSMKIKGRFINKPEFFMLLENAVSNPLAFANRLNFHERLNTLNSQLVNLKVKHYKLLKDFEFLRYAFLTLRNTGFLRGPRKINHKVIMKVVKLRMLNPKLSVDNFEKLLEKQMVKLSGHELHLILSAYFNEFDN